MSPPALRPRLFPVVLVILCAVAPALFTANAVGNIPDPSLSSCEFPDRIPAISAPVVVPVEVNGALAPVNGAFVEVVIVVEAGALAPGQEVASATTNIDGHASPTFPEGILGEAEFYFETYANGILLCTSGSYLVMSGPKLALHGVPASQNQCGGEPTTTPCSEYSIGAPLHTPYTVYLVVANLEPVDGVSAISFGLSYNPLIDQGASFVNWTLCATGLQFDQSGIHGAWPAPGSGSRLTWLTSPCPGELVEGFEDEGAFAIAGSFYMYAYGNDTFAVTANETFNPPELVYYACGGSVRNLPPTTLGQVQFSGSGNQPGFNPCTREGVSLPPPEPPPPPPPPEAPALILHIGEVVTPGLACESAPTLVDEIVTTAEARADGSARYFVYLLGSPELREVGGPGSELESLGIAGVQLGINYTSGAGLNVFSWNYCSDLEFAGDHWPESGSGNTITWVTPENCQSQEVVVAGYFYLTAYSPGVMSIAPFPPTGQVKTASCEAAESVLEQVPLERVGWVSMGGGAIGADSDGCNPMLEPCLGPTPAIRTTWGQLKTKYAGGQ